MSVTTVSQERNYAQIPRGVLYHPELTGNDIRVYATLSDRAGRKDMAWPSVRRIADDLGMSTSTVGAALTRLEEVGVIEVLRDAGEVNRYHLPLKGVAESDTPPSRKSRHPVAESDTQVSRKSRRTVAESATEQDTRTKHTEQDTRTNAPEVQTTSTLDELKQVLVELFGEPPPQHWSLYNRIATWIRDRGGTPAEVRVKAGLIAEEWGKKAVTPTALEKHWTRYDARVGQLSDGDVERYQAEVRSRDRRRRAEELEAQARGLPS